MERIRETTSQLSEEEGELISLLNATPFFSLLLSFSYSCCSGTPRASAVHFHGKHLSEEEKTDGIIEKSGPEGCIFALCNSLIG